jgi:hypothetical protein
MYRWIKGYFRLISWYCVLDLLASNVPENGSFECSILCSQRWMYHLLECRWLPRNHHIHEIIPPMFYEDAVRPLHWTNFPTMFPIFRGKFPVICLCNDLGILSGSRGLPVTLRMKRLLNLTPGISPTLGGLPRFVVPSLCPSESCPALFLLCPLFFWDVDAILLVFFDEGKHDGGPFMLCLLRSRFLSEGMELSKTFSRSWSPCYLCASM